jgi:hypothetical protein
VLDNAAALIAEFEASGKSASDVSGAGAAITWKDVNPGGANRTNAISNCKAALAILTRIPNNKTAVAAFPAKSFVNQAGNREQALADGWGNPIILCPPAGLEVKVKESGAVTKVTAPGGRPFWASAGPDGNFSTGDDNVYSFAKK